jgi:hypothetical protein
VTKPDETQRAANENRVDPQLARPGGLTYLEIPAVDPARSATFYERVVGWQSQSDDRHQVKFSDPAGCLVGRFVPCRTISREPGLLPYIYVADIRAAVDCAPAGGGEVVKPPYPEGNLLVALVRDPAGNIIGLWQAQSA